MKKTKKSTHFSTKHGVERYHSRIKAIGDLDSKLKYIIRNGNDSDCYFGDFYKYLQSRVSDRHSVIIHEEILYIFDKFHNMLITTYPIPDTYLPTKKYFLSSTKRKILENAECFVNQTVVITFFNKKVTAKILDVEFANNNALFSAIAPSYPLLKFSFEDIYNIELSKEPVFPKFSLQNEKIKDELINFFLGKKVQFITQSKCIDGLFLETVIRKNKLFFKIETTLGTKEIQDINVKDINILPSDSTIVLPSEFEAFSPYYTNKLSETEKENFINCSLGKIVTFFCEDCIFTAKLQNRLIIDDKLWIRIYINSKSEFMRASDICNMKILNDDDVPKNVYLKNFDNFRNLKKQINRQTIIYTEFNTLLLNMDFLLQRFNIVGTKNIPVSHSSLGGGIISYFIQNTIIVDFIDGKSKSFDFPDCFNNNILKIKKSATKSSISKDKLHIVKKYYTNEKNRIHLLLDELHDKYLDGQQRTKEYNCELFSIRLNSNSKGTD